MQLKTITWIQNGEQTGKGESIWVWRGWNFVDVLWKPVRVTLNEVAK